jgi:hypothetical protein
MSTAAAPPVAASADAAPKVLPLSLTTVKTRYPNLYQTFSRLSSRQISIEKASSDLDRSPIDAVTGLATTIMGMDFTRPLPENDEDVPMKTDSDENKFRFFLWKMLHASESGSIGGDACRLFDTLYAAYKDIMTLTSTAAKFKHWLGWINAAVSHGLRYLMERGDPDRNRLLFKYVADEFKKIFRKDTAALGIENDYRDFAIFSCGQMQQMLRSVKEDYGEYCENYSFNYIYKPRPKKAAPAVVSLGVHVATTATVGKNNPPCPSPTSIAKIPGVQQEDSGRPKVNEDDDNEAKPWEEKGWVPRTTVGEQKSPDVIRGELQHYIDKSKSDGTMTRKQIIEKMGVNPGSFRRYMNQPYKNQWNALKNSTYWAGAKLLEEARHNEKKAKKAAGSSAKRNAATTTTTITGGAPTSKKSKKD